jgi:hypothetical protein
MYWDPEDRTNRVAVPRHGQLPAYVAEQVIAAIEWKLFREGINT